MRLRRRHVVPLCLVLGLLMADLAAASGFGLFQHGGRAIGQVGALTARAPDPSALTYNPAAITQLEGLQAMAGLDFNNAEDAYESPTGRFAADHIIQFPPLAYLTWKPKDSSFALGIGLDAPFWYVEDWEPALFPGRFISRRFMLRVYELHPVAAWEMGGGWSIGGGVRYLFGSMEQDDSIISQFFIPGTGNVPVELERNADADVDDLTYDLALHYTQPAWGWGVVYRGAANLKGNGDLDFQPRNVPNIPGLQTQIDQRFGSGSSRQSFEIPRELRGGIWVAPYPELRLELDASWQSWSSLEATSITYSNPIGTLSEEIPRDWDDTISLRLGVEGEITEAFMLFGGVAYEPSPATGENAAPDFPRSDAMVYAAGFSYGFPQISFDVGYSFHEHNSRSVEGQEPLTNPTRSGRYTSSDQVWGFGVRWRFQ